MKGGGRGYASQGKDWSNALINIIRMYLTIKQQQKITQIFTRNNLKRVLQTTMNIKYEIIN